MRSENDVKEDVDDGEDEEGVVPVPGGNKSGSAQLAGKEDGHQTAQPGRVAHQPVGVVEQGPGRSYILQGAPFTAH